MWKEGDTRAHTGVQGWVRRGDVGRERGGADTKSKLPQKQECVSGHNTAIS